MLCFPLSIVPLRGNLRQAGKYQGRIENSRDGNTGGMQFCSVHGNSMKTPKSGVGLAENWTLLPLGGPAVQWNGSP